MEVLIGLTEVKEKIRKDRMRKERKNIDAAKEEMIHNEK